MLGWLMMHTLIIGTYSDSIKCQIKSNGSIDGLIEILYLVNVYEEFRDEILTVRLVLKYTIIS